METEATKSFEHRPAFRWSHYRIDTSKAQPLRVEDLPVDALPQTMFLSDLPELTADLYFQSSRGHQPFFHAYSSELAVDSSKHYLHISCCYGEPPFLWLSHTQHTTCEPKHGHFYRMELVPLRDGLGARWHRFTYQVSYDFKHVLITAQNPTREIDRITGTAPGQMKRRQFSLTVTGELPIIASTINQQRFRLNLL